MKWYEDPVYIKMCEKATEIQDINRLWKRAGKERTHAYEELILDSMSFYAYSGPDYEGNHCYGYLQNFGANHTWNCHNEAYINTSNLSENRRSGCAVNEGYQTAYEVDNIVWLPRQDQLWDIVYLDDEFYGDRLKLGESRNGILINYFSEFINSRYDEMRRLKPCNEFYSREQLIMAFVMKGKYNKVWTGEDWI